MNRQIAIDGPAGAGKSTVARVVATKLHMNYMDTGAMYRAVAYAMGARGIDPKNRAAVAEAMDGLALCVEYAAGEQRVLADGRDVTPFLRTQEIAMGASAVASVPKVRLRLVELQRETAAKYDVVMDGRDIGTYVLPQAKAKFFITASSRVRAERRAKELEGAGAKVDRQQLEQEIVARDKADMEREFAPLKFAEDAIYVDTSDMTAEQVIDFVCRKVEEIYG